MSKKIVAMLMAVAMAFSLLPVTVLAEENKPVAKVGDVTYTSLDAAVEAAKDTDDAVIDVLADCTTAGLNLSKNLTIQGAEGLESKPTITFTGKGIALWGKALTFKDCKVEMTGIGSTPYTAEWSWMTISASKDASLTLDNTTMMMDGTGTASGVHAIYFGSNNKLTLENGSELTIKNYPHNALEWDGGDGDYNVNIKDSTFISDHNRSGFVGTFYATIDNSTVEVINSTGNGSNGTYYTIKNGSNVTFNNNGNWGISAWRIDMTNGSTLTAMDNGYSGVWTRVLNVDETCTLDVERNGVKADLPTRNPGIVFQDNEKIPSTIKEGATVTIKDNAGSGIYTKQDVCNLTIGSATITNNGLGTVNDSKIGADKGGGIYNIGTMKLGENVVIYNNHAKNAGDDIYSLGITENSKAQTEKITFGDVGEEWVLDDCDHDINGWYDDGSGYSDGTYSRWAAHTYPSYISQFSEFDKETGLATLDYEVALKAAHDVIQENPIQPDSGRAHSKSKEATKLVKQSDGTYTSDVTLTLPSVEEAPVYDVVFVLDKSTSAELEQNALDMLKQLQDQIEGTQTTIKVGVVIFNKGAHVTELKNLTTEYAQIEEAIKEKIESGTNTHAGLLAGKELLDNDKDVTADHKYLIFVSDGITYTYNKTPTAIAWGFFADAEKHFAGPDNYASKYGSNVPPANWSEWLTSVGQQIQDLDSKYEYPYGTEPTEITVSSVSKTTANSVDKALYLTNEAYQSAKTAGYHCYAMEAEGTAGKNFPWGPSFMSYLAGGKEVSFEDIHNDIYYLLSEGSTVEDVIGYGTDNRGNAYNFDFVNDISKLTLKVGTETLEATDLSLDLSYGDANETARYGFAPKRVQITTDMDQSNIPERDPYSYDYVLHYYQNGKDGKSDECFVWDINVPVSKFAPVSLTYQVKLTNAQTSSGTYGTYDKNGSQNKDSLYTNKSATLYPVDSDGVCGIPENFQKPTVSYTVSGGNSGGNNGGNSKPSLNTKDHYGYIIGYPVDYYTGQPTTDQTKKPVRPEGKITRAEVATIYFRMLTDESRTKFWSQSSGYSDVKTGDWFNNAVSTLSNAGIIAGYEDGSFRPNGYITRAEFATIAARFFDVTYNGKDLFPDISGHWAKDYINQAANKGFVNGYEDGTFKPDRNITRAEAVTLVNRTLDRHPDKNHFTKDMLVWPDNMDQTKWYYADMQEATNSHTYQMKENSDKTKYENWTKTLPIRNWEALEKAWSNANSSQGNGNVV
ncbi:S-layer homology domain-containing protein [Evtepia sp.]|uniref:S-layer homology domain-containing protein n=1 Tax=Evtepia sp. TaxID=2773933 RepID=UPI002E78FDC2|nr:S-layer homology domain-containing protein [Evtepia sp.]MEE0257300.1 S-layer homology domain-containing protein [Evtepia sp.]